MTRAQNTLEEVILLTLLAIVRWLLYRSQTALLEAERGIEDCIADYQPSGGRPVGSLGWRAYGHEEWAERNKPEAGT